MSVRLSVAIQHHPDRADLLPSLLAGLDGAEVVTDPEPEGFRSPWRTYRRALENTPRGVTHRLIVQDDVQICSNFRTVARAAIAARPDRLITFWHGAQPHDNLLSIKRAANRGEPWARLNPQRWCPVVALVWPVHLIEPALAFVDRQNWPEMFRADDEIVGRYIRQAAEYALATVPSLVEHPDVEPSLIGRRTAMGRDRSRVAYCWIGDCDGRMIDWSPGEQ